MAVGGAKVEGFHEVLGGEFTCPVCFELFEEPKCLPYCAHNICRECLEEILKRNPGGHIECPVCRARSPVPNFRNFRGIAAFPTNSLLVRLIESTPGRKEEKAIKRALKTAQEAQRQALNDQELLKSRTSGFESVRKQAEDLKREISERAEKLTKEVKEQETSLAGEVEKYLEVNYGSGCSANTEKSKLKLSDFLTKSTSCIKSAEKILNEGKMNEIVEMSNVHVSQLEELASAPAVVIPSERPINVAPFSITFREGNGEVDFGQINNSSTDSNLQPPQEGASQASFLLPSNYQQPSSSQHLIPCSSSQEPTPDPVQQPVSREQPSTSQPRMRTIRRGQLMHRVNPETGSNVRRVAVCQETGDVGILLYNGQVNIYSKSNSQQFSSSKELRFNFNPQDIAFSNEGHIIVISCSDSTANVYSKSGTFVYELDVLDDIYGYQHVRYLTVDSSGRLLITVAVDNEDDDDDDDDDELYLFGRCIILVYGSNYHFRFGFGRELLSWNCGRAEFHNSRFYVPDRPRESIIVFSASGDYLQMVDIPNIKSITFDHRNNKLLICRETNSIFVCDASTQEYLWDISTKTREASYIALTKDNRSVIACFGDRMFGNRKFFDVLCYIEHEANYT